MPNASLGRTILTYVIAGPPAGAVAFISFMALFEAARSGSAAPDPAGVFNALPLIALFAYILGALPAIITSLFVAAANRRIASPVLRVLAAMAIGALASVAGLAWVIAGPNGGVEKWVVAANFAWTGAGAALAAALTLEWTTRPRNKDAP
jgi:hypothetical protein